MFMLAKLKEQHTKWSKLLRSISREGIYQLVTHLVFFSFKHVCTSEAEVLENVARTKLKKNNHVAPHAVP